METIPKTDCQKIGFFRKAHGVHGELILEIEEQFEYSVEETDYFFVELEGLLIPFYIADEGLRFRSSKSVILKFDWVDSESYAKRFIGNSAFLYKTDIIDEQEQNISSLDGFLVTDSNLGKIGTIKRVDDYAGNIVFTVSYNDKELLIPFHEEMLIDLNEEDKSITLILPDGLIDI